MNKNTGPFQPLPSSPLNARVAAITIYKAFTEAGGTGELEALDTAASASSLWRWIYHLSIINRGVAIKSNVVIRCPACWAAPSSAHKFQGDAHGLGASNLWALRS